MKARLLLAAAGTAALCSAASATLWIVDIIDFDFVPDPTILVGDTVRWTWSSNFHSSTASAGQAESWDSGNHNIGFTFDHTFTHVGAFNYYCDTHGFDAGGGQAGGMSGTIIVNAVPEPATLAGLGLGLLFLRKRRKA